MIGTIAKSFLRFFVSKTRRRFLFLILLGIGALTEFNILGLARRTFVFYNVDTGTITVEDRMLKRSVSQEEDIIRYLDDALLGPVDPDLLPLFPRGTRLKSLIYRDGVVYANLSEEAALPPVEGGLVLENFRTLYTGIFRNFSFVRDVRFFVDGNAVHINEFRQGG